MTLPFRGWGCGGKTKQNSLLLYIELAIKVYLQLNLRHPEPGIARTEHSTKQSVLSTTHYALLENQCIGNLNQEIILRMSLA